MGCLEAVGRDLVELDSRPCLPESVLDRLDLVDDEGSGSPGRRSCRGGRRVVLVGVHVVAMV